MCEDRANSCLSLVYAALCCFDSELKDLGCSAVALYAVRFHPWTVLILSSGVWIGLVFLFVSFFPLPRKMAKECLRSESSLNERTSSVANSGLFCQQCYG